MAGSSLQSAVLDTNLVVRILISPFGVTSRLLVALEEQAFHFVTSETLLEELVDVLRSPRLQKHVSFSDPDLRRIVGVLRRVALGVFIKFDAQLPTPLEVAQAKLKQPSHSKSNRSSFIKRLCTGLMMNSAIRVRLLT